MDVLKRKLGLTHAAATVIQDAQGIDTLRMGALG